MNNIKSGSDCAVIVAHPDDEILWAGGTMLMNPQINWNIITITRKSDPDRSEKFYTVLDYLNANGRMGDLDDGPEQKPLKIADIQDVILELLYDNVYELIFTHNFNGEYTRHRRHEETCDAVIDLWKKDKIKAKNILRFAYEDGGRKYLPRAVDEANLLIDLPGNIWQEKYKLVTEFYGFARESFEAKTTPRQEAFWNSRHLIQ